MMDRLNIELRDLPARFDGAANALSETMGPDYMESVVLGEALKWLALKQAQYSGDDYLDQLEKNAVYFHEQAFVLNYTLAEYLHTGEPRLLDDQIQGFVLDLKPLSLSLASDQINFVRHDCSGCASHWRHSMWLPMIEMKSQLAPAAYLEELEYNSMFYRANNSTAEQFLLLFLQNQQFAGSVRSAEVRDIVAVAENRSLVWASTWAGLLKPSVRVERDQQGNLSFVPVPPPTGRPHWREVWGKQFDEIARSLR
jgi:hypothetical protein